MRFLKGFSLLEMIFVLVILGILITLAIPSYTQYLVKTRRQEAITTLLDFTTRLENYFSTHDTYQGFAIKAYKTEHGWYHIDLQIHDTVFELKAIPQGIQAQTDKLCGILLIDQSSQRKFTGTGNHTDCW